MAHGRLAFAVLNWILGRQILKTFFRLMTGFGWPLPCKLSLKYEM